MGFDKLTADLCGESVLARSLRAFECCTDVRFIVLVAHPLRVEEFRAPGAPFSKLARVVAGGDERPDSVHAGLAALEGLPGVSCGDFVGLHDAARPLVAPATISEVFREAVKYGAAAPAERVADTLHRSSDDGDVIETVPRTNLWRVQTPQIFRLGELLDMPPDPSRTDEISAYAKAGGRARMVANPLPNFKITIPADLALARALLSAGPRPPGPAD